MKTQPVNQAKKRGKNSVIGKIPRSLTKKDKNWSGVPSGGEWFNDAELARKCIQNKYGLNKGFVLAWALPLKEDRKTSWGYWYGAYLDYEEAQSEILLLSRKKRHGFEMISEERECNFYCDIEWIGLEDVGGVICLRIANKIRSGLFEDYGKFFSLHTCYSSRLTADGWKNSIHVVASGIMFSNNHGGEMRACAERIEATLDVEDRNKIDMKVYDRNRVMRMVLSCKRGSVVPLRNITGDPFSCTETLYSDVEYSDNDPGAQGNFSITHNVNDSQLLVVMPGDIVMKPLTTNKKASGKKLIEIRENVLGTITSCFPSNVTADLQALCDIKRAEETCVVTGGYKYANGMHFAKCQNNGIRHCIANHSRYTHESENAYLSFFNGFVQYRCFSSKCEATFRVLGPFPESLKVFFADEKIGFQDDGEEKAMDQDVKDNVMQEDVADNAVHEDIGDHTMQEDIGENADEEECEDNANEGEVNEDQVDTEISEKNVTVHLQLHPFPELHDRYFNIAKNINVKYLDSGMYRGKKQAYVVESSCNTGKTKSVFDYAARINLKMICISNRITQVDAHQAVIIKIGERVVRYDSKKLLRKGEIGLSHIISTIDSISKTVNQLRKYDKSAKKFGIFLDEYHSIVQYLWTSTTLSTKRRRVLKDLQWLVRNAYKVIVADNTLSDHDFDFLETSLSEKKEPLDISFTINKFQTFQDTPAIFCEDREKNIKRILEDNEKNEGCVIACNTRAEAIEIFERIKAATKCPKRRAAILMYDKNSGKSTNIPRDILEKWDGNIIIYSPKITTGLDFHPSSPTNVYFFVRGEGTVCPATAVQMVTRTRNIKTLYICATRMRNKMRYETEEEMNDALDSATDTPEYDVLQGLGDIAWSPEHLEDVYSDNKFSLGYRKYLWHHELMVGSYVCNFIKYLEKRGFIVTIEDPDTMIPIPDPSIRKDILNKYRDDLGEELLVWQDDKPTDKSEYFDSILCKLRDIPNFSVQSDEVDTKEVAFRVSAKSAINEKIARFRGLGQNRYIDRVNNIFLNDATFKSNQNLVLAMYTLDKIKRMKAHAATLDYALPNAKTGPACVCLLHELIEVFNTDLQESSQIKVSDLSLHQKQYDEEEEIEITDEMWGLFSYNCRAIKKRPETRRGLVIVIFTLAQKIFGKWFTDKKVTTSKNVKNKTKCYNYVGNPMFLAVYVRLTDWSKHDLSDFEPAMVSKYKLGIRQRRDVGIDKQIRDAHDPVKIKEKEEYVKRKRALLSIEPQPKRLKTSKTAALSQKEQDEQQCVTQDVQKPQLIDTKLINKRERLITKKKKIKATTASRRIILSNKDRNPKRFKMTSLTQYDPPPKLSNLSEAASLSQKKQYEQKCIKNNLEKKLLYRSKMSLKTVAKRALAQKKYSKTVEKHALAHKNTALVLVET